MGRRNLIAAAALVAAALCVPAATAAGTGAVRFVLAGATEPSGSQAPQAYLAARPADEARWVARLTPAQRERARRVDFSRTVLFAGFLDGRPCTSDVRMTSWMRSGRKLIVNVTYTPPPAGVAACIRTSTRYLVVAFARVALGRTPNAVELVATPRS